MDPEPITREPVPSDSFAQAYTASQTIPSRRAHRRVPVHTAVTFSSESNFYVGFSEDMSAGGCFVATIETLPHGSEIELTIQFPDGHCAVVHGIVRWQREYNERTPDVYPGMGIQFTDIDTNAIERVRAFVSEREALFYED